MKLVVEDKTILFPDLNMSEDDFFDFCMENRDLVIERDKFGDIHILSLSYFNIGVLEAELNGLLGLWNKIDETGYVLSSTVGFTLPNGAVRSPDASWVSKKRMDALPESEKELFAHICPDFVVELSSKTNSMAVLTDKMQEYMENGCRLGFLINPYGQQALVYKPGREPETVTDFEQSLSGEDVLPGFLLELNSFRL